MKFIYRHLLAHRCNLQKESGKHGHGRSDTNGEKSQCCWIEYQRSHLSAVCKCIYFSAFPTLGGRFKELRYIHTEVNSLHYRKTAYSSNLQVKPLFLLLFLYINAYTHIVHKRELISLLCLLY